MAHDYWEAYVSNFPQIGFRSDSFWYDHIPDDVAPNTASKELVDEFLRQAGTEKPIVGINTTAFTSPVYFACETTPTTTVEVVKCWPFTDKQYDELAKQFRYVPIPPYAQPADGDETANDSEMTIYRTDTDTLWEFGQAKQVDGRWHAGWGGRMDCASKWPGIWPYPFGASATGLPFVGGQITLEELMADKIEHVIGMAVRCADKKYSLPANRTDGEGCPGPNCIMEGMRLRLDPNVNVDSLNLHAVAKTIARAAQVYGFVIWDQAGAISLRARNNKSYNRGSSTPDVYAPLFGDADQYSVLNGFPWERLQFLPKNYGFGPE